MNLLFVRKASALLLFVAVLPAWANDRKVQHRYAPVYPELARRMHIEGMVRVEATVSPDGQVTTTKAVSGNTLLQSAAERAIRKWKFAPESARSTENVDVDFRLSD